MFRVPVIVILIDCYTKNQEVLNLNGQKELIVSRDKVYAEIKQKIS